MADWKMICNIEDIPKLGSRVVKSAEGEIDSGEVVAPDVGCVRRYPTRVDGNAVFLEI